MILALKQMTENKMTADDLREYIKLNEEMLAALDLILNKLVGEE